MIDIQPVSLERVQRALHADVPLRVVHRGYPVIRGRVVAWSNMATDVCSVDLGLDGIAEPVVVERAYLLEHFDEGSE